MRTLERRHDLDALRASAMLLGIGLHASLSYFPVPWPVQDSQRNDWLSIFFLMVHGFRMPLFFIVSGYFTMMMYRRRGLAAVVKQRTARILVPCLLGLFTVIPLTGFVSRLAMRPVAIPPRKPDSTTLVGAIRVRDAAAIETLIGREKEVNRFDDMFGVTPLNWAVMFGDPALVERLIEHGADVNGSNRDGNRPMHAAAFLGRDDLVELLLKHHADGSAVNQAGERPVRATAADWGVTQYITALLEVPLPERAKVEAGRLRVRQMLGDVPGPDSRSVPEKGPVAAVAPKGLASMRDAYQQWLRSDRWNVAVGAATWHLFYTDVFSHLWFLCFLCWMVAGFAGIALLAGRSSGRSPDALPVQESTVFRFGHPSDTVFRLALCLIPLTLLPQWLMGASPLQFGPDTSSGLLPQPHLLFYYGLFFGFGSLLFESERFGRTIGSRWWIYLGLGLFAAFPAWRYSIGNQVVGAIAQVAYAWAVSVGLIGLFRRFLSRPSRTVRYVSDSSYWLYLAHLPLVIALQSWTRDWPASAFVKFMGVNVVSVTLLLLSYHCLVRPTWIGVLLNGKRERRVSDEPAAAHVG